MTQRSVILSATLAGIVCVPAPSSTAALSGHKQEATALTADRAIEQPLTRGSEHRYELSLTAGEFATVVVEQRDIDLTVQVSGADRTPIAVFQDELGTRRPVRADVVADSDGTYAYTITNAPGTTASGAYTIRVSARRSATDADRSMQDVYAARTAAARLQTEGRHADARTLLERALATAENVRGPDDLLVAAAAAQLAEVYLVVPDWPKAETLFRRALTVRDKAVGAGHPASAYVRARLAIVLQQFGQVAKAQEMVSAALAVIEQSLGPSHPWAVRCLISLGNIRVGAGDLDRAEEITRRALTILESTGDATGGTYLGALNNLAVVYRQKKDYQRAEDLFRRALAMNDRLRGSESAESARILSNLGLVALNRHDHTGALDYYGRALAIHERLGVTDHPDVAQILNNVAIVHQMMGDRAKSLEAHFRALQIRERTAGPYHAGTLQSVANIALMYWLSGDETNAIAFQRRADAIVEAQLALNIAVGSERQKVALLGGISERTNRTISLHLRQAPHTTAAAALAALVVLQRKGRVLDAMTRTFATVRERMADPTDRSLLDQLNGVTSQLARIALNAREEARPKEHQQSIAQLESRRERLESELSAHDAEFRAQTQTVTLEAVRAAIPADSALIEFVVYRPFDPRADGEREFGDARYAAYVITSCSPPRGVDLGAASEIEDAVESLRAALRDPKRRDVTAIARQVDQLVLQPLRPHLGTATRLLISPDGALNLVPFDALADESGRYAIERYAITYLTSGRDLLRMRVKRGNGNPPVVIADPLFGEPRAVAGGAAAAPEALVPAGGKMLATTYFAPLPASAAEARAIKTLFPDARVFTGARATKAALRGIEPPRMLHVASHGFFLDDAAANALLRSGLAFAGANLTGGSRGHAILTALEASGLNLWGTKLVTLSACDTGVGEVRDGDGVHGLRRAFVLAGAETLVMSLWPVSDAMTRETMVRYYTGLKAGAGRGDALRRAKLWMLSRRGRQHPFYWASFIQSGEWANLAGRR